MAKSTNALNLPSLRKKMEWEAKRSFKIHFTHASADRLLDLRYKIITDGNLKLDFESKQLFNSILEAKGLSHYAIY